jgi:hypothetical protein
LKQRLAGFIPIELPISREISASSLETFLSRRTQQGQPRVGSDDCRHHGSAAGQAGSVSGLVWGHSRSDYCLNAALPSRLEATNRR